MPNTWIKRTFEELLALPAPRLKPFPVWLLLGPRQAGKSSLLKKIGGTERQYVNLDDLNVRARAIKDPEFFFRDLKLPVLIDEIQYAPELLSPIKRAADEGASTGSVWLTGSQNFQVMKGARESLAGRVAVLNLLGLSDEEKQMKEWRASSYFENILVSSFPKLHGNQDQPTRELYLSSYVQTYVERDVMELLGVQKRREFEVFIRMCALRTAQIVNYDEIAKDVGVSAVTIKEWLHVLESSFVVKLVHPYFSNKTKRLIKSPKLYFLDMGLAAYLSGWQTAEQLRFSPMAGAAFETQVFGNIWRHFKHRARDVEIDFWRTKDGEEIDFLVRANGKIYPVEIKLGTPQVRDLVGIKKIADDNWERGSVVSLGVDASINLNSEWQAMPFADLPFLK